MGFHTAILEDKFSLHLVMNYLIIHLNFLIFNIQSFIEKARESFSQILNLRIHYDFFHASGINFHLANHFNFYLYFQIYHLHLKLNIIILN